MFQLYTRQKVTIDYTSPEAQNQEVIFKDYLIEEEAYRIIDNAVNALPTPKCKNRENVFRGKQNKEIAEILDISVNSVKTLKYNALNVLRNSLKRLFLPLDAILIGKII